MNSLLKKFIIFVAVMAIVATGGYFARKAFKRSNERRLVQDARSYIEKKEWRNAQLCLQRSLQINPLGVESFRLNLLPVVVYTGFGDKESVKKTLALHVQNFLVKPYHDDAIYTEIAKAAENPWRLQHFEEEKTFCQMMGFTIESLHQMLESLRTALEVAKPQLQKWAEMQAGQPILDELASLSTKAEEIGAWGVVACLKVLTEKATLLCWPCYAREHLFTSATHSVISDTMFRPYEPYGDMSGATATTPWIK